MPLSVWPRPPFEVIQAYEARRPGRGDIGALIVWATWTVEGLHYLDEIDSRHHRERAPTATHSPDVVDIAHVRWATGSAITALDLCAAALGREFCGWAARRELDLGEFDSSTGKKDVLSRRANLPPAPLAWVDKVLADPRYQDVQGARHPLTHSRLVRRVYRGGPGVRE